MTHSLIEISLFPMISPTNTIIIDPLLFLEKDNLNLKKWMAIKLLIILTIEDLI